MVEANAPGHDQGVISVRRTTALGFLRLCALWQRASRKGFSRLAAAAFAEFGRGSTLERPIRLAGTESIAIGDDVFIGAGSWLQTLGDPAHVVLEIGDGTEMAGNCTVSAAQFVKIGKRVLIARNVYISDHVHAFDDPSRAIIDQGITGLAAVVIGDGAWLGENVVVCPGVRIGAGAVIGANAVVRSDVPDHTLAAGVPARIIRDLGVGAEHAR